MNESVIVLEEYVPQLIATLVAVFLLWLSKFLVAKLTRHYGIKMQKSELRRKQTKHIMAIILNILFVFIIAIIWGVQPGNLLVVLSSVFAVLGVALFAQWSILSNISAGIIMFFGAPFRIGDHISIIDKDMPIEAVIENIYAFYTHIRTDDNRLIVLPNSVFLQKIVAIDEGK